MNKIYFDYAATTPVDPRVQEKMNTTPFGNASSVHSFGREALARVDEARGRVAEFCNADFNEIIFTSGATEANNIAIMGLLSQFRKKRPEQKLHMITSKAEHASVRNVFEYIEDSNLAEVTWLDVSASGVVDLDDLASHITPDTILISLMYINNETGVRNPIRDIGKLVKKVNEQRETEIMNRKSAGEELSWTPLDKVYFHTDAVQATQFENMNTQQLHVDLMSISGHKIYGPKGVGALYVQEGTPVYKIQFGGDQENDLRSGTLATPLIAGLGEALMIVNERKTEESARLTELRDYLIEALGAQGCELNGSLVERGVNTINIHCPSFAEAQIFVHQLDQKGIAVSAGSACAAGAVEASYVIEEMYDRKRAQHSLRISLGRETTREACEQLVSTFKEVVQ